MVQDFQGRNVDVSGLEDHKISDALFELIEPYRDDVDSDEDLFKLLDLAVLAWNLSFFPKRTQREQIEELLQEKSLFASDLDLEFQEGFKKSLRQLIARKKRHFSSYKRLIIDFELEPHSDSFDLFVVSTPIKKK